MKQLEITTNKRLLIVEFDDMDHLENVISCDKQGIRFCTDNDELTELICKGSELTEDIANEFVRFVGGPWSAYVDYNNEKNWISTALQSFISAIESKGYHWRENPVKFNDDEADFEKRHKNRIDWERAEFRTLNPEKCIIFEIP